MEWQTSGPEDQQRQRAENGFADMDWQNAHIYLTGVIGQIALKHRDSASTCPPELEDDEWQEILQKIGEPLAAYARAADANDQTTEQTAAAREALRLYAEWFDKLWD